MEAPMNRRTFAQTLALGVGGLSLSWPAWAQGRKTLKVGHTGITWPWGRVGGGRGRGGGAAPAGAAAVPGASRAGRGADASLAPAPAGPPQVDLAVMEGLFRDVAETGFHGIEVFAWQVDAMEAHGGIGTLIDKYKLPLIGVYGGPNLSNPAQRQSSLESTIANAKLVRKYGGRVIVFGPNGVNRSGFVFNDHRANIIAALNDGAKAVMDIGLTPALHPHTGTCIETAEETYAVMENVDTRYVKFGPDIGQLAKAGADPVKITRDFLSTVQHVHLKDYSGGDAFLGYAPIGRGKVDLVSILDMCEGRTMEGMVMVELDSGNPMPMTARETAEIARDYLRARGHEIRG